MIEDRKGEDLLLLDIQGISILADYFVIGSVSSERQAGAIVDSIKQEARERFAVTPRHIEGDPASGWILVDYGDVVVHLFSADMRTYYGLEELWEQGRVVVRML